MIFESTCLVIYYHQKHLLHFFSTILQLARLSSIVFIISHFFITNPWLSHRSLSFAFLCFLRIFWLNFLCMFLYLIIFDVNCWLSSLLLFLIDSTNLWLFSYSWIREHPFAMIFSPFIYSFLTTLRFPSIMLTFIITITTLLNFAFPTFWSATICWLSIFIIS